MAKFTTAEWQKIRARLNADPRRYGLPERVYGSVVLASANIRKLGAIDRRDADTWAFFADVFRHFDLLRILFILGMHLLAHDEHHHDDSSDKNSSVHSIPPRWWLGRARYSSSSSTRRYTMRLVR